MQNLLSDIWTYKITKKGHRDQRSDKFNQAERAILKKSEVSMKLLHFSMGLLDYQKCMVCQIFRK